MTGQLTGCVGVCKLLPQRVQKTLGKLLMKEKGSACSHAVSPPHAAYRVERAEIEEQELDMCGTVGHQDHFLKHL